MFGEWSFSTSFGVKSPSENLGRLGKQPWLIIDNSWRFYAGNPLRWHGFLETVRDESCSIDLQVDWGAIRRGSHNCLTWRFPWFWWENHGKIHVFTTCEGARGVSHFGSNAWDVPRTWEKWWLNHLSISHLTDPPFISMGWSDHPSSQIPSIPILGSKHVVGFVSWLWCRSSEHL